MAKKTSKKKSDRKAPRKKKKVIHQADRASDIRFGRKKTSGKKTTRKVLRKAGKSPVIHCMLAPTEEDTLLLPTSVLAEVVDFEQPSPMAEAPPWLIGQIEWEKRQVPVFSFFALINGGDPGEVSSRSKIMVIKSLSESSRVPYLGVLLSELPRMIHVKEFDMEQTGDKSKSLGVFSRITLDGQDAIVPDLDRLTHLITHATYGALPITHIDD
jgi:chemosensory pili system protein ChpC